MDDWLNLLEEEFKNFNNSENGKITNMEAIHASEINPEPQHMLEPNPFLTVNTEQSEKNKSADVSSVWEMESKMSLPSNLPGDQTSARATVENKGQTKSQNVETKKLGVHSWDGLQGTGQEIITATVPRICAVIQAFYQCCTCFSPQP